MYRIESKIDTNSVQYKDNFEKNRVQHLQFKEQLDKVKQGGSEKSQKTAHRPGKDSPAPTSRKNARS